MHFLLCQTQTYVLWLEICMDHFAHPMQVVEADKALSGHLPYHLQRSSLIIVSFNHFQEICSKNFEDSHEVLAIWTVMEETVEELDAIRIIASNILQFLWISFVIGLERIEPFLFDPV